MDGLNEPSQFLIRHGLPIVFAIVFMDQMGIPIPAVPFLLAAGALSAVGKFSLLLGIGVTIAACLIADVFWFYLGRYRGNHVLGILCRISLEPGFTRVRPLLGGVDVWREGNHPMEMRTEIVTNAL